MQVDTTTAEPTRPLSVDNNGQSPLDAALADVEREHLAGATSTPQDDTQADPFAAPPPPAEQPAPGRRGRKPNPNGRAAQRQRAREARAAAAAGQPAPVIQGPPPPADVVEFQRIAPEAVTQTIKQLDAIVVKMAGTAPLSTEEADAGGQVFAPVLDHYMPMLAEKGGVWLPAFSWVVLCYGPRAYEILDARQKRLAGAPSTPVAGARASDTGAAGFSGPDRG